MHQSRRERARVTKNAPESSHESLRPKESESLNSGQLSFSFGVSLTKSKVKADVMIFEL